MRRLLVGGVLVASVGLSVLALSATAEEPDGTTPTSPPRTPPRLKSPQATPPQQQRGSERQRESNQPRPGTDRADLRLNAVVEELDALRDEPGFGSFVLDQDRLNVTVGWKGGVPSELSNKVGERPDGVTVAVRPVAYDESEMRSATDALGQEASRSGWPWSSVRPNDGCTGLVVELNEHKVSEGSPEAMRLEQRIRASTSVPITFEYVEGGYLER